jgi:2-succinyl-5-enolpyruvyl-6-hydroxy-3-cyclohexene-1-carboxylate synthase
MSAQAELGLRWCWALVDALAAAGVRHAVVSPGARSTPLTIAALRHPALRTHVVVDERSAAFYALGLAKAAGAPAMLIATSGSAIANWHPAVVEADLGRVPLLLLSADRPPEHQDCGANQAMDQLGLFGSHARAFHQLPPPEAETAWLAGFAVRCVGASLGPLAGPVQINVPLREPLVPAGDVPLAAGARVPRRLASAPRAAAQAVDEIAALMAGGRGAVVCGPEALAPAARAAVVALARRLNVPVLADLLSNLRDDGAAHAGVLAHPDQVVRAAPAPDWLLRLGGTPLGRPATAWLARARGRPQIVVADHPRVADPDGTATHLLHADPASLCDELAGRVPAAPADWLAAFLALDQAAARAAAAACAGSEAFEGTVLRALLHGLPAGTPVLLGNSLTVRVADWLAGRLPAPLRCFGNRGVSGIDGNISTACGIAAALGPTLAIVGDLTFLHDLNALSLGRGRPLTVLLLDNHGGGIFDHLPQTALPEFERGWLTPQDYDPVLAARAFGIEAVRAADAAAAVAAVRLGFGAPDLRLVHLPIDRALSAARIRAFHSASQQGA